MDNFYYICCGSQSLSLFLYCGLKLSSKYSRLEEEKYKEDFK